tara:strand:- start:45 stop:155 length:111 start_codon:yes stop_codon:yes gene_type:complete
MSHQNDKVQAFVTRYTPEPELEEKEEEETPKQETED